jgi:hypothetical protein
MGAILPKPPQGSCLAGPFLFKLFQVISGRSTIKSENCNLATIELGNRKQLVQLQKLRTRDFDELAKAFSRWDLRFRRLGLEPFRGHFHFLQLGRIQGFRTAVTRSWSAI